MARGLAFLIFHYPYLHNKFNAKFKKKKKKFYIYIYNTLFYTYQDMVKLELIILVLQD